MTVLAWGKDGQFKEYTPKAHTAVVEKRRKERDKTQKKVSKIVSKLSDDERWFLKQELAEGRYYGNGGTIHGTTHLDVETDSSGRVVSVWYRCQMLPFKQSTEDAERVREMRSVRGLPKITGVEVLDDIS